MFEELGKLKTADVEGIGKRAKIVKTCTRELDITREGKSLANGRCKEYDRALNCALMYRYLLNKAAKNICVVRMFIYTSEKLIMKESRGFFSFSYSMYVISAKACKTSPLLNIMLCCVKRRISLNFLKRRQKQLRVNVKLILRFC